MILSTTEVQTLEREILELCTLLPQEMARRVKEVSDDTGRLMTVVDEIRRDRTLSREVRARLRAFNRQFEC